MDGGRAGVWVAELRLAQPQVAQFVLVLAQVELLVEVDPKVKLVALEVALVEPEVALVEVEAYFDPVEE